MQMEKVHRCRLKFLYFTYHNLTTYNKLLNSGMKVNYVQFDAGIGEDHLKQNQKKTLQM